MFVNLSYFPKTPLSLLSIPGSRLKIILHQLCMFSRFRNENGDKKKKKLTIRWGMETLRNYLLNF